MDEPFAALDALTREQMNIELQPIWSANRKTVLFVTQGIQEAVFLSDRVVVMSARPGRISRIVDVPFERPRHPQLMGTAAFAEMAADIRAMFDHSHSVSGVPAPPFTLGREGRCSKPLRAWTYDDFRAYA